MTLLKTSLDWHEISSELRRKSANLTHGREVRKLISGINNRVTMLSKAELEERRGKKHQTEELIGQINEDIETVEGFLLVAAIIG